MHALCTLPRGRLARFAALAALAPAAAAINSANRDAPVVAGRTAHLATKQHREAPERGLTAYAPFVYGGGPVMHSPTLYLLWYGAWSASWPATMPILQDLSANIGGTSWANILSTYYDGTGNCTSAVTYGGQAFDASYSQGTTLTTQTVADAIYSQFGTGYPASTNAIYMMLATPDVNISGFCTDFCGWHSYFSIGPTTYIYGFIGGADRCLDSCSEVGSGGTSPNGDVQGDAMASTLAHEIAESVTDPQLNAYVDGSGNECGDRCAWTFGSTYSSGGGTANVHWGSRDYLIQQDWVNLGSSSGCVLGWGGVPTPSGTPPGTPSMSISLSSTRSASATASNTATPTASRTASKSPTSSLTASKTASITATPVSITATPSGTPSASHTATNTPTASVTASITPSSSHTASNTGTPSNTPSNTPSTTGTPTASRTPSSTPSTTASVSATPPSTATSSMTASSTPSRTNTPSLTPTATFAVGTQSTVEVVVSLSGCNTTALALSSTTGTALRTALGNAAGLPLSAVTLIAVRCNGGTDVTLGLEVQANGGSRRRLVGFEGGSSSSGGDGGYTPIHPPRGGNNYINNINNNNGEEGTSRARALDANAGLSMYITASINTTLPADTTALGSSSTGLAQAATLSITDNVAARVLGLGGTISADYAAAASTEGLSTTLNTVQINASKNSVSTAWFNTFGVSGGMTVQAVAQSVPASTTPSPSVAPSGGNGTSPIGMYWIAIVVGGGLIVIVIAGVSIGMMRARRRARQGAGPGPAAPAAAAAAAAATSAAGGAAPSAPGALTPAQQADQERLWKEHQRRQADLAASAAAGGPRLTAPAPPHAAYAVREVEV